MSPEQLYTAYCSGYFPLPDPDTGEILWFRPDPRAIIPLNQFHVSHSLRKNLKNQQLGHQRYTITHNVAFGEVMLACADRSETWITSEFKDSYGAMRRLGLAHSLEVWQGS